MFLFGYTDDQNRRVEWSLDPGGTTFRCTLTRVRADTARMGAGWAPEPSEAFRLAAAALVEQETKP